MVGVIVSDTNSRPRFAKRRGLIISILLLLFSFRIRQHLVRPTSVDNGVIPAKLDATVLQVWNTAVSTVQFSKRASLYETCKRLRVFKKNSPTSCVYGLNC